MSAILDLSESTYRDYNTAGVSASGEHEPVKSDIRSLFSAIDVAIGAVASGIQIVSNVADRNAFYAIEANRTKLIYINNNNGSATDPANGVYEYVGAARFAQGFYAGLSAVVQPLVTEAKTARDQAVTAAAQAAAGFAPFGGQYIGAAAPAASGTITGNLSFVLSDASTVTGFVRSIKVGSPTAQAATIFACTLNGDGTLSIVPGTATQISLAVGVNTLSMKVPISLGQYVGIKTGNLYNQSGASPSVWYTTGLVGTNTAKTVAANYGLQFSVTIEGTSLTKINDASAFVSNFGSVAVLGVANPAASASFANSFSLFDINAIAPQDGIVEWLKVTALVADPNAQLIVASVGSDGKLTLVSATPMPISVGSNFITSANPNVLAGQMVGIWSAAGGICRIDGGNGALYIAGLLAGPGTMQSIGGYGLQYGVQIGSGTAHRVNRAGLKMGGLGDGLAVDNSGATDATAALSQARTADPNPYLGPGTYPVTSLRAEGDGLWGPGKVLLNGAAFFIPKAPLVSGLQRQFRSALMRQVADRSGMILLGDSLTQGTLPTGLNWLRHWSTDVTRFANAFVSPTDLPLFTQFQSAAASGVAHGITLPASPAYSTAGPAAQALVLGAGQSITLTGLYAYVDVLYEQAPSAGSLAFSFNGGAAYRTVNCAGSAASDMSTYARGTQTGQGASGTYSITATGGPVTITGVVRMGAETDALRRRLPFINCGVNGMPISALSAARIASAVRHAKSFGGVSPGAIMAFGENDQVSTLPADIYANHMAKIADMKTAGIKTIYGCDVLRPGDTQYTYAAGCSYEGANGAVRAAYQDSNIPVLKLSSIDFNGLGYFTVDAVHPGNVGQGPFGQVVVEGVAMA